jgi:hypothetical protein
MSFPPATEMFQFAGFASHGYGFTVRYPLPGGLPHSEIPGSKGARASPGLFAACHVLHRLSTPRHSPDALRSLAPLQQRAPSCTKGSRLLEADGRTTDLSLQRNTASTAKSKRSKNKHTMLKRSPNPGPRQRWRTTLAAIRRGRTHANNTDERRSGARANPEPARRSIALPALDQTCLFTMYKEHSLTHRTRPRPQARLSPSPTRESRHEPVTPSR